MLLIFDLDDTLIPTSEQITPFALRKALTGMIDAGLLIETFDQALSELIELSKNHKHTIDAMHPFVKRYEGLSHHAEVGIERFQNFSLQECSVERDQSVLEEIECFHHAYKLTIVTRGRNERLQREKIDKFGLDPSWFHEIAIVGGTDKGPTYSRMIRELGNPKTVVIGDRIDYDLKPAKLLGCTTVWMRQGRGSYPQEGLESVDYSISSLKELKTIVSIS